jgi:O-methyltransferase involved in polyketide biosynthesis
LKRFGETHIVAAFDRAVKNVFQKSLCQPEYVFELVAFDNHRDIWHNEGGDKAYYDYHNDNAVQQHLINAAEIFKNQPDGIFKSQDFYLLKIFFFKSSLFSLVR